jgi:hypothetical protein
VKLLRDFGEAVLTMGGGLLVVLITLLKATGMALGFIALFAYLAVVAAVILAPFVAVGAGLAYGLGSITGLTFKISCFIVAGGAMFVMGIIGSWPQPE